MPGPRSIRSVRTSHSSNLHNSGSTGGGGGGNHHHPSHAGPPSPTLSSTTRASIDLPSGRPPVLITRADLRNSLQAYEKLLSTSKAYTNTMLLMAKASSDLAAALEECARVKGAHESGSGLQAASGLHYLKSNYEQVLCDTFWKDFSIPLLSHYDTYKSSCTERQMSHDKAISEKSRQLKETESRNLREGRRKERDLNSFRRALADLQSKVDEIDDLKSQYYHEVLESEEEVWEFILAKVALVVRSQIEISERISSKGLSDPILEPMLSTIPDPFDSYGPPKQDDQIFSILPPTSLLASATSSLNGVGGIDSPSSNSVISPVTLLSPSTPATGLPRNNLASSSTATSSSSSSSISTGTLGKAKSRSSKQSQQQQQQSEGSNAKFGGAEGKRAAAGSIANSSGGRIHVNGKVAEGLGLGRANSSAGAGEGSISTSESSSNGNTALFGSESMDFEELLERDRHASRRSVSSEPRDQLIMVTEAPSEPCSSSGGVAEASTTSNNRRKILSVIDEDFHPHGPLSGHGAKGVGAEVRGASHSAGAEQADDEGEPSAEFVETEEAGEDRAEADEKEGESGSEDEEDGDDLHDKQSEGSGDDRDHDHVEHEGGAQDWE